ncbi:MAG: ketopantoate reductase family protein [Deltaproteobacteria bacterium]|nr:ketopantoate reductase family protein [Candidatus Anaeroferrophillus wilburensis]MBN2888963.1 ketopantoate reductase family protein [Deltaproteobacteria bacterium]
MEKIKRVAILGAGAMGAYFAAAFFDTDGIDITVVARDQRYETLQRQGLVVNGKPYAVPVSHPDEVQPPADLIIVALKHHHLPEAVGDLKNLVGDGTAIISVMNGLDSEAVIGEVYGKDKLLYAVSVGIDAVRHGNQVVFSKPGVHYFGEQRNEQLSPRVRLIQEAFDRAGIAYETPADMIRILWWKFMINVGMNQSSAVMRAPYGVFQSSPQAQAVMRALMDEVIILAKAAGVNLVDQDVNDWNAVLNSLAPAGKTSMLQDMEAGRKTEVEIFGGKVAALGRQYGIPTPVNQTLMNIIQVLES